MTIEEIKAKPAADLSTNSWLREVCLQLALLNENSSSAPPDSPKESVSYESNMPTSAPPVKRIKRPYNRKVQQ